MPRYISQLLSPNSKINYLRTTLVIDQAIIIKARFTLVLTKYNERFAFYYIS